MSKHPLEQEVLDDNQEGYDLCVNLAYLIEQSKHKEKFKDIQDRILRKAAGYKLLIDYLSKNNVMGEHNKVID
jgi:hypothetical protein